MANRNNSDNLQLIRRRFEFYSIDYNLCVCFFFFGSIFIVKIHFHYIRSVWFRWFPLSFLDFFVHWICDELAKIEKKRKRKNVTNVYTIASSLQSVYFFFFFLPFLSFVCFDSCTSFWFTFMQWASAFSIERWFFGIFINVKWTPWKWRLEVKW